MGSIWELCQVSSTEQCDRFRVSRFPASSQARRRQKSCASCEKRERFLKIAWRESSGQSCHPAMRSCDSYHAKPFDAAKSRALNWIIKRCHKSQHLSALTRLGLFLVGGASQRGEDEEGLYIEKGCAHTQTLWGIYCDRAGEFHQDWCDFKLSANWFKRALKFKVNEWVEE